MTKKILIPLTKSLFSHKILTEIEKFCQPEKSKLILYYITRPPKGSGFAATDYRSGYALEADGEPMGPKAHPVFASQEEDSIQSEVEVALLSVTNSLKEKGFDVSIQICFVNEIVSEMVRIVKRDKINLIAMSTRARTGVQHFFFSNIAEKVLERVDIPVLLIHPKDK
ncbi:MAG: universal stress protein [Anaerolineae bacterium]|jgi:nucleotide-binding universal stress UspA family protein|nr:universal stress protein [Anaerolineae bacterium]MBT3713186.1 universal stress protein [Anaerolineae bacterium]MBT4310683.1 universal stress protein [Anaerolineae bacterium]MBT4457033.1 universal stress protein [Anaerolineae bacterium]MBT6061344.1 universal stress protein [Anaerolineae bacterium]